MSVTIKRKSSSKKKSIKKFITRKRNNKIRKHTIKRGGGNGFAPKIKKTQQPVSSQKLYVPGGPPKLEAPIIQYKGPLVSSLKTHGPGGPQGQQVYPVERPQIKATVIPYKEPPVSPLKTHGPGGLSQGPQGQPRLLSSQQQIFGNSQKVLQESTESTESKEPIYTQTKKQQRQQLELELKQRIENSSNNDSKSYNSGFGSLLKRSGGIRGKNKSTYTQTLKAQELYTKLSPRHKNIMTLKNFTENFINSQPQEIVSHKTWNYNGNPIS